MKLTVSEAYILQTLSTQKRAMAFARRALELGATIVQDSITFPGTEEEQNAKIEQLLTEFEHVPGEGWKL